MDKKSCLYLFYALRPKHWIKNGFVFIPLIFGRKLFTYPDNMRVVFAAFIFCLASSSVYLLNDALDLSADKAHPVKRLRPLASGHITWAQSAVTFTVLGFCSAVLAFRVDPVFGGIVTAYLFMNILYSRYLKKIALIDVACVALFFLLRIIAGTIVAQVKFSHWMIFMIVFLAMFLAFIKRRQDIRFVTDNTQESETSQPKYSLHFIDWIVAVLTSSIVLVYMMYTIDSRTVHEFGNKRLIFTIPFVYYGIFRYLYLMNKKDYGGDPTFIVFKDRATLLNILLWGMVCIVLIYFY